MYCINFLVFLFTTLLRHLVFSFSFWIYFFFGGTILPPASCLVYSLCSWTVGEEIKRQRVAFAATITIY